MASNPFPGRLAGAVAVFLLAGSCATACRRPAARQALATSTAVAVGYLSVTAAPTPEPRSTETLQPQPTATLQPQPAATRQPEPTRTEEPTKAMEPTKDDEPTKAAEPTEAEEASPYTFTVSALSRGKGVPPEARQAQRNVRELVERDQAAGISVSVSTTRLGLEGETRLCVEYADPVAGARSYERAKAMEEGVDLFRVRSEPCGDKPRNPDKETKP